MRDYGGSITWVPYEKPDYTVTWKEAYTSLGGNIGLNFTAALSDDLAKEPSAFLRFTFADKVVDIPVSEATTSEKNGETIYRFICRLNSMQMAELVTAQFMTEDGPVGKSVSTSIAKYCEYTIKNSKNPEMVALSKAILNYGAAAQVYFNYKTDVLANANLKDADKVLPDVDASPWKYNISGADADIKLSEALLVLDSETSIRIYFTLAAGKTLADCTFTVDGVEVTPISAGNRYYVTVENIAAHRLGDMHTFCLGGYTMTYAGLSYTQQVLSYSGSKPDLINIVKALYAYNQATLAYID